MQFAKHYLDLSIPRVMGILNITPDSFSDGGELMSQGKPLLSMIIDRAASMVKEGADFLDIGGESTRPGAEPVSETEELARVIPVVEILASRFDVVVSVDTSNATVMTEATKKGAGLINDVRSLSQPGALAAAANAGVPVCLMHMQGLPASMQQAPRYQQVVVEVVDYLKTQIQRVKESGIEANRLILDPGFGFGKTLQHNLQLLAQLDQLNNFKMPVLVGLSRKRMLGAITGRAEKERGAAGLAAAVFAVQKGARIIRTHDVAPTGDALKLCRALLEIEQVRT